MHQVVPWSRVALKHPFREINLQQHTCVMMILWPGWLLIRKYGGLVCSQARAWRPGLRKSAGVLLHAAFLIHTHMFTQIHRPPEAPRKRMISSWLIFSIEVDLCMSDATPPPNYTQVRLAR